MNIYSFITINALFYLYFYKYKTQIRVFSFLAFMFINQNRPL